MKKTITFCMCLFTCLAMHAQDEFPLQFVGSDGQIIPDGTVLNLTDVEVDDIFGEMQMPAGLCVTNISDETVFGGATYTIQTISNGWFQTCFPSNCIRRNEAGTYETTPGNIAPGELRDMLTEWFPDADGICIVTYQLLTFNNFGSTYFPDEEGPTITLRFATTPDGIGEIKGGKACSVTYFDLSGQRVERPSRGVFMVKTTCADGSVSVRKNMFR